MSIDPAKIVIYERLPSPEGVIVLKRITDKKRRSRRLSGVQKFIRLATKHHAEAAEIYTDGVRNFADRSEVSALKKKDGLLKDMFKNSGKASRKTAKRHSKLPRRFLRGLSRIDFTA